MNMGTILGDLFKKVGGDLCKVFDGVRNFKLKKMRIEFVRL